MKETIDQMTSRLKKETGTDASVIEQVEGDLGFALPSDYRMFITRHNGAEGDIGLASYVQLWPVQELPKLNRIAQVSTFAPGLVLFGSDGGGTSYAFDTRQRDKVLFVEVQDCPLSLDEVKVLGTTFAEFLDSLYGRR